jgi:Mrp family chromosome partitioning ATPase
VPTNLQLLEKANRAAHLFGNSRDTSGQPSQSLVRQPKSGGSMGLLSVPAQPHITFRFQPQFLDLAHQLLSPKSPGESFSVGICPARGEDPVSRFIAFFASSISQMAQAPVLLIETNFRNPCLAKHLGAAGTPGLRELLAYTGKTGLECIHPTRYENLHVLPAGAWAGGAGGKEPRNLKRGLARLYKLVSKEYQSVIIAYPAWNEIPSIRPCYALADAMLLAVRPGACGALTLRRTVRRLRRERARLVGSVLSAVEP